MVAPVNGSKKPAGKPTAPAPAGKKAEAPAKAEKKPTISKDWANFSSLPKEVQALEGPTVKTGDVTIKLGLAKREIAADYDGGPTQGKVRITPEGGQATVSQRVNAETTAQAAVKVASEKGKTKTTVEGQLEYKDAATTAKLTVDSDADAAVALSHKLTKEVEVGGKVARKGHETGVEAKLTVKPAKGVEVSLEGARENAKKGVEGKARLKLDKTSAELGYDAKGLSAGLSQQITDQLSVGVNAKQDGKVSGKLRYQADALSLTAEVGEKQSVEVGYKKNNFEASAFAKSDKSYGVKFGYSARF